MSQPVISVIVCTYNRNDLLSICLRSLENQKADKNLFEVIIINNNSTDNTQKVANKFVNKNNNFRVFIEKKQGLSNARNRGWKEARGEYVAYIDDDAKADSKWILEMVNFIHKYPNVMVFGGPYYGFSLKPLPKWFPPNYGTKVLSKRIRKLKKGKEYLSGSNMVFHRDIFKEFGGFKSSLGMSGNTIGYGEEPELQDRLFKKNIPIYYYPSLRIEHLIAEYKTKLIWQLKSYYAHGKSLQMRMDKNYYNYISLYNSFVSMFINMVFLPAMPFKRRLLYSIYPFVTQLGKLEYYLKHK